MANPIELDTKRKALAEGLARGSITEEEYDAKIAELEIEESHNQAPEESNNFGGMFGLVAAPLTMARSGHQIIEEDDEYRHAFSELETKEREDEYIKNYKTQYEARYGKGKAPSEDEIAIAKINRQVDNHILARQNAIQSLKDKIEKKSKGNIFDKISGAQLKAKLNRYSRNTLRIHGNVRRDPEINFLAIKARLDGLRIAKSQGLKGKALSDRTEQYRKETLKKLLGDYWLRQQSAFQGIGAKDPRWREKLERKRNNYTAHINKLMSSEASSRPKFSFKNFFPKRISVSHGFSSGFSRGLSSGLNGIARGISSLGNGIFNGISKVGNGIRNILNNLQNILGEVSKLFRLNLPLLVGIIVGGIILVLILSGFTLLGGGGGGGGGNGSSSVSGSSGSCPSNASISQMPQILQNTFNIIFAGESLNNDFLQNFYNTVCTISKYQFINLIGLPTVHITMQLDSKDYGEGDGYTCTGNYTGGLHDCDGKANTYTVFVGQSNTAASTEFIIMHEFAHIVQFRNQNLVNQFCSGPYGGKLLGNNCSKSGFSSTLPTYNCRYDYGKGPFLAECFSDMVGEYFAYNNGNGFIDVFKGKPSDSNLMQNYPANFPAYYSFATQNIFIPITTISTQGSSKLKVGNGYCSINKLITYFGADNAPVASCICAWESGSISNALNYACLRGGTADYSVGLFQINLLAHCPGAIQIPKSKKVCVIDNQALLNQCYSKYLDPIFNIKEAVNIYNSGHGWDVGWHAEQGKCF